MKKSVILAASVAAIMAGTAVADTTVYGHARMGLGRALTWLWKTFTLTPPTIR